MCANVTGEESNNQLGVVKLAWLSIT